MYNFWSPSPIARLILISLRYCRQMVLTDTPKRTWRYLWTTPEWTCCFLLPYKLPKSLVSLHHSQWDHIWLSIEFGFLRFEFQKKYRVSLFFSCDKYSILIKTLIYHFISVLDSNEKLTITKWLQVQNLQKKLLKTTHLK